MFFLWNRVAVYPQSMTLTLGSFWDEMYEDRVTARFVVVISWLLAIDIAISPLRHVINHYLHRLDFAWLTNYFLSSGGLQNAILANFFKVAFELVINIVSSFNSWGPTWSR
jgi:hypothetical protein